MKKKMTLAALAAVSVLGLSACGADSTTEDSTTTVAADTTVAAEPGTIVEVASANKDFEPRCCSDCSRLGRDIVR